jgi:hypothetical protein
MPRERLHLATVHEEERAETVVLDLMQPVPLAGGSAASDGSMGATKAGELRPKFLLGAGATD